jgi:hypothetical protein
MFWWSVHPVHYNVRGRIYFNDIFDRLDVWCIPRGDIFDIKSLNNRQDTQERGMIIINSNWLGYMCSFYSFLEELMAIMNWSIIWSENWVNCILNFSDLLLEYAKYLVAVKHYVTFHLRIFPIYIFNPILSSLNVSF